MEKAGSPVTFKHIYIKKGLYTKFEENLNLESGMSD